MHIRLQNRDRDFVSMALFMLWVFSSLISISITASIQGGLMTFTPVRKYSDGTILVNFQYKESYSGECHQQHTWGCYSGNCGKIVHSEIADRNTSQLGHWCQADGVIQRNISSDKPFELRETGCCWISNLFGTADWSFLTHVDMGTRSDLQSLNRSPILTILSTIRISQNCVTTLWLLAHDPDGDQVRCRFGQAANVDCELCYQHPNVTLNENLCSLKFNNTPSVGLHVFELVIEDFPMQTISLSYEDGTSSVRLPLARDTMNSTINSTTALSRLPLHFAVEVDSPVSTCVPGIVRPQFLPPTPAHGDVYHAVVAHEFQFLVRAQAAQATIHDFQVSGPLNITKSGQSNSTNGIHQVLISWTPEESECSNHVSICFAAETFQTQSDMRCIIIVVDKYHTGEVDILCTENTMTIVMNKSAFRGLNESHLRLNDPSCTLASNGSHVLATMSLNTCGTQLEETHDGLIFRNEIVSVDNTDDVITRKHLTEIPFSCTYSKIGRASSQFKTHQSAYVFTETSFGSFSYVFEFYSNNTFRQMIEPSAYPVQVQLQEMLYISIQAHTSLSNTELFVESCMATPKDDPSESMHYDIIKNGCNKDNTIVVYPSSPSEFRFEMEAFKFIGEFNEVYISCTVILCEAGKSNTRCAQGCTSSARRRRSLSSQTDSHQITQGPLRVAKNAAGSPGTHAYLSGTSKVFAGAFAVAVLLLCGVLIYKASKHEVLL